MEAEYAAHKECIQAFLQSSVEEEVQKVKFLQAVSSLCTAGRDQGFFNELKEFCEQHQVVENIKALVEEEPVDHLHTAVLQEAMLTLTQMSKVEELLQRRKKSILQACFTKVFLLPPSTAQRGGDNILYFKTLDAMDTLLESLALNSQGYMDVWRILQTLLPFTDIKHTAACERALARIAKLTYLMASSSAVQVWSLPGHDKSLSDDGIINNILGQLLGHLMVCCTSKIWRIQQEALDALQHLFRFIQQIKRMTSPEDDPEHSQGGGKRKVGKSPYLSLSSTRNIAKAFGEYLHPADKTSIVLKAIEAMTDSCVCDKEELISILEVATTEPASWLTEVRNITHCIYDNLQHISGAAAQRSLKSLLLSTADQNLTEMIQSLIDLSPACDRAAQAMWEALRSEYNILVKLLRELRNNFWYLRSDWTFRSDTLEACIQLLNLVASSEVTPEDFAELYKTRRLLWCRNAVLFSLTLRGLVTLSKSPDTARKILVLLPELREALQSANTDTRIEALLICRNVMGHLKEKAISTALQLAKDFMQHFDDVSSQVRELSICLFKEIIQMVDWKHKWKMQKVVRKSLVPLVLHMSDEIESVAEVSYEALCVAVKVLKWKQLGHRMRVMERWRPVECLLEHDWSRAEEYVCQSMPYLRHAQVSVRMAAVRFIGLAGKYLEKSMKDTMQEICNALYNSSKDDESQVSSLALQTMDILKTSWAQARMNCSLLWLCCCL